MHRGTLDEIFCGLSLCSKNVPYNIYFPAYGSGVYCVAWVLGWRLIRRRACLRANIAETMGDSGQRVVYYRDGSL